MRTTGINPGLTLVALFLVLLNGLNGYSAAPPKNKLPAFPGAEGFGTTTPGGRGGRVIPVTNLNASGPGSLRQALQEKGPRIVLFQVGGIIALEKDINIDEPFVTIAGQTAPGDGICLKGAAIRINTHDVVVRYLRVRVGDDPRGPKPDNRDGIGIGSEKTIVQNVMLDHCSVSWAIDENVQLWYPCNDITIQWCLISESLQKSLHPKGDHGMGLLVGDHARRVTVHHNLFAHNMDRNPLLKGDTECEVINNVVYNWRNFGTGLTDPEGSGKHQADIIGNLYLPGPQSRLLFGVGIEGNVKAGSSVYLQGNRGHGRAEATGDEWGVAITRGKFAGKSTTRVLSGERVRPDPVTDLLDKVLAQAGATFPKRDLVDARAVQTVRLRKGRIIDSQKEVNGWPEYIGGPAPADTDRDGIPDAWETAQGLNPHDAADGNRLAPSGYTWVEEYLNSLVQPARP